MPTTSKDIQHLQALRLRRALMGLPLYGCLLGVVLVCYFLDQLPGWVAVLSLALIVLANATFIGLIASGLNLYFSRPDMTMEQVLSPIIPGLLVLFYVENTQARTALLLLAQVPLLFAILGMTVRHTLLAGLAMYAAYLFAMGMLYQVAPERTEPVGDAIIIVASFFAVVQISLVGGYIGDLRKTLEVRNRELNQAVDTIAELVNRDELTGIFNRRWLLRKLSEECERSRRTGNTLSLAILDIDHFKQVNDEYGHPVGDQVLIRIARTIESRIRKLDHFGRLSGEEFLLVMPHTELDDAVHKLDQLRALIGGLDLSPQGCPTPVTFSAGVTSYLDGEPSARFMKRADSALYAAKNQGRNTVVPNIAPALSETSCLG